MAESIRDKLNKGILKPRLMALFNTWYVARRDLDSMSAGKSEFVDWVVSRICGVRDRDELAHWYVMRSAHVRARWVAERRVAAEQSREAEL